MSKSSILALAEETGLNVKGFSELLSDESALLRILEAHASFVRSVSYVQAPGMARTFFVNKLLRQLESLPKKSPRDLED